jgi:hypothetical protein
MPNDNTGLSFEEAFEQAQEEIGFIEPVRETPINAPDPLERIEAPIEEQPAVENDGDGGNLFADPTPQKANEELDESHSYEVTVNGEKSMKTIDELINGYQRQADYTRGKQEVADLKTEHNNAITLWEALEEDYSGTVERLMARTGMQGKIAQAPDQDMEALIEAKVAEKLASDPRMVQFENENSLRSLNVLFAEVEKEFNLPALSDADKQHILEKSQEWETTDIRYVVYRLIQARNAGDAKAKNVELVSSSRSSVPSNETIETPVEYYSTVAQAWESALAEEGN